MGRTCVHESGTKVCLTGTGFTHMTKARHAFAEHGNTIPDNDCRESSLGAHFLEEPSGELAIHSLVHAHTATEIHLVIRALMGISDNSRLPIRTTWWRKIRQHEVPRLVRRWMSEAMAEEIHRCGRFIGLIGAQGIAPCLEGAKACK